MKSGKGKSRKALSFVVLILTSILLSSGKVSAETIKTEQLVQDNTFTSSNNSAYWTYTHAGDSRIDWLLYHYSNKGRWYDVVQARSDDETTLGEGYGYIWQKINIPNGDIINATFSLDYEADEDSSTKEYVWVAVKDGYNVSNEGWESQLGMAYEKIYTANLTDIVKQYAGKSLYVLAGLHIVSGSKLKYVETTLYNVSLTITYKVSSSGSGGWWGNGGSWSGGGSGGWWGSGSGWSGGGGFWHGSGGVWFAGNTSGNATYVEYVVGNIQRALAIVGGAVISVLWVKEALDFFSDDPDRKSRAKENALKALLATLIIAMAVLGTIWLLAGWAVGAFDIVGVIL